MLIDFLSYADVKIAELQTHLHDIDNRSRSREELCSKINASKTEINKRALERVDRKNKIIEVHTYRT